MLASLDRSCSRSRTRLSNGLWLGGLMLALALGGCATTPTDERDLQGSAVDPVEGAAGDQRWYYFRFRFHPKDDGEVDSALDLLVANEILWPVLHRYRDAMPLWRFHRRWPDDPVGHQFSFIALTDAATAALAHDEIAATATLKKLQLDARLRDYQLHQSTAPDPGAIEATSDGAWPELVQREWPHFIMGASRMWLGLVRSAARKSESDDIYLRYRETEDLVDEIWFEEANHAFFHHLSAVFGYQPVRVIRRDIMTF